MLWPPFWLSRPVAASKIVFEVKSRVARQHAARSQQRPTLHFSECARKWNQTEKTSFMAIVVNKPIPEFDANATGGLKVSNTSHLGHVLVMYFYPKDNTPGCTTEAMQFRDRFKDFVKAGATVFGVSRDNMKSHDEFKTKLELPFELVADTEEKMCHMFGVVKNKIMYGKKVKGIERSTFLIGADGILKAEWRGLKVPGHVDDVLKAVKALKKAA
jgi:peroxiredoxin Q/BCP